MCLFRKYNLQGSRGPETRSLLVANEQFPDKRNAANGGLYGQTLNIQKAFVLIADSYILIDVEVI